MAENAAVTVANLEVVLSYKTKGDPKKIINRTQQSLANVGKVSKETSNKVSKMFESLKRIATYRLLRTVLKEITQGLREGVNNLVLWDKTIANTSKANETMSQLGAAFIQLKNTFGATFMPILQVLMPAIQGVTNAIVDAMNVVNQFVRSLQGYGTYIKANAVGNYDYAKSLKAVKNQLLGFDELNVLKDNNSGSGGINPNDMFVETNITKNFGKLAEYGKVLKDMVTENLDSIKNAAMISPLPIGLLLALTGNVGVGIPLMVAGAVGLATSGVVDWESVKNKTGSTLSELVGLASIGVLGIGVMLALASPSNLALGLGLIVAGATGLGSVVALGDGTKDIKTKIADLMTVLSLSALALGGILFFSGASKNLGIGLMIAGATGLASSVAITDGTTELQNQIAKVSAILGGSLVLLGAILFFSGAGTSLGLGLILAGATSLASAATLSWDWLPDKISEILGKVTKKIEEWGNWFQNTKLYKFLNGEGEGKISQTMKSAGLGFGLGYGYLYGGNYASGGIPPMGSMFVAGETGDPEFVGNVGGRTAVYNSDQLAGSLASANEMVVDAIFQAVSAINAAIANQPTPSIRIGDREIYQASERGRRTIGGSLVQGV